MGTAAAGPAWAVILGALLLAVCAAGAAAEWWVRRRDPVWPEETWVEPTDDEIYNRPGVEGGIGYDMFDEPGSLGENDWRL